MRLRKLNLNRFLQFKDDLSLDLTYPVGHPKQGQPLEKVCFIGQSGTGKSTLLHLIRLLSYQENRLGNAVYFPIPEDGSVSLQFELEGNRFLSTLENGNVSYQWKGPHDGRKAVHSPDQLFYRLIQGIDNHLIYYPAEGVLDSGGLEELVKSQGQSTSTNKQAIHSINFNQEEARQIWEVLRKDIVRYREEEIAQRLKISQLAEENSTSPEDLMKATEALRRWKTANPNPITDLAENCLDPLLNLFGLQVKTDLDFRSTEDIELIRIETLEGQEVPAPFLSTGTKQVVLSAMPMYLLNLDRSLVLYDEPERSLYPDIQTRIIDYFQQMCSNSQLFFATHSPVIASAFEPWEVVKLKFDKDGKVYREEYFEGERHVDNCFSDPRYLDWSGILQKLFDVGSDGNSAFRAAKMKEFRELESKLENMRQVVHEDKEYVLKLWDEYHRLSKLLNEEERNFGQKSHTNKA